MAKFGKLSLKGVETAQRMVITHPVTGLPLFAKTPNGEQEAFLMVKSFDSPEAKAFDSAMIDRRVSLKRRPTQDEFRAENLLKMAKLVAGGPWLICSIDGEHIDEPCNEDNARELFKEADWLLAQAIEFAAGLGNFVKS